MLAAAAAGDTEALGTVLAGQYDRCFAVCMRVLRRNEDALDATQEAMIAIAKGLAGFDGRSSFSTWCYRVATNAALDELRRRSRRPIPLRTEPPPEPGREPGEPWEPGERARAGATPGGAGADPVGTVVSDRLAVVGALASLPDEQRMAVVLRDIADLDYSEIATVLGVPIGTVRSRIARGRMAIAAVLGRGRVPSERPPGMATPGEEGTSP